MTEKGTNSTSPLTRLIRETNIQAVETTATATPPQATTPTTPGTPITTSPISGFFKSSFFSNVSSNISALSQTIQTKGIPEMNKRLAELQQKARELPSQLAGDLESERAAFVQQNKNVVHGSGNHKAAKGSGKYLSKWGCV